MKPEEQRVLGILATILEPSHFWDPGSRLLTIHRCSSASSHLSWDYRSYRQPSKTEKIAIIGTSLELPLVVLFLYDSGTIR